MQNWSRQSNPVGGGAPAATDYSAAGGGNLKPLQPGPADAPPPAASEGIPRIAWYVLAGLILWWVLK